jgi:hypothetical protein
MEDYESGHVHNTRPKKGRGCSLGFLLFNILISAAVMLGVLAVVCEDCSISLFPADDYAPERVVTLVVVHTATPNPNVTQSIYIITATPMPGDPNTVAIPDDVRDETPVPGAPAATLPPESFDDLGLYNGDPEALPEGCIMHMIADGENPSLIAEQYEVSTFSLLTINNLTEDDAFFLQIGDMLVIPLETCPMEIFVQSDTAEPGAASAGGDDGEGTPEVTPDGPQVTPTVTLAPTAADAQIEIVEVIGAGDITAEYVFIRNNGNVIDIGGWTMSDGDGNVYTFPETRRLFTGTGIEVHTRVGESGPIQYFWGRDTAVFGPDDVVVLTDSDGNVQANVRLDAIP